jgi:hypothetical protein
MPHIERSRSRVSSDTFSFRNEKATIGSTVNPVYLKDPRTPDWGIGLGAPREP